MICVAALAVFSACGHQTPEEEPVMDLTVFSEAFTEEFQEKIASKNDGELIAFFKLNRSKEAITTLVDILKNKKNYNVQCHLDFANAKFDQYNGESAIAVIPVTLVNPHFPDQEPERFTIQTSFTKFGDAFLITEIDGDLLHQRHHAFYQRDFWATEFALEYEKRKGVYDIVERLQSGVDSIIWFTRYQDRLYFYFTKGEWANPKYVYDIEKIDSTAKPSPFYKMGLLDEKGSVIIPAEYDLIGTLGFDMANLVEVKDQGKYGMYHLESKLPVIPAVYDVLIPYSGEKNVIIAKDGNRTGWFSSDFLYSEGLPPIAQIDDFLANYRYLNKDLIIQQGNQAMMEIPKQEHLGDGFVVPPSYLVSMQVMDTIENGFMTTRHVFNAGIERKEFTGFSIQTLKDKFNAFIVLVKEKYMEGREEFYHYNKMMVTDDQNKIQSVQKYSGMDMMSIRYIAESDLFEGKTTHPYWFWEIDVPESGISNYYYFQIEENGNFQDLPNQRIFAQTKFVKMDSSYLKGKYLINMDEGTSVKTDFLSAHTIQFMLDELLADNGYLFPDSERGSYFYYLNYHYEENVLEKEPSLEKVVQQLSEIERHNFDFLGGLLPKTLASR